MGNGYIVESAKKLIDFVFKHYPVERIQSRCVQENIASHRVLEKIQMKYEGTLESSMYYRNRFWDMQYFRILRSEWDREHIS